MATFWRILTFRGAAYEAVKNDRHGFATALTIFIAAALIATLGQLMTLQGIAQQRSIYDGIATTSANLAQRSAELQQRAEGRVLPDFLAKPLDTTGQFLDDFSVWLGGLAEVLKNAQPPLGKQLSESLIVIGGWLTNPFSALTVWLPAALLLFICSKLLRGTGTIREHLSLVLLAFAPQVLLIVGQFSLVPALQGLVTALVIFAGWWSLAILIVALMHSHGFSAGRSIGTLALAALIVLGLDALVLLFWSVLTGLAIRLLT